ncbi:MAG: geranylgeranyl reductase family protein [Deltaproteobacteria bacterium]|nr:geranylgeranyl reductase family protein [Deltaproteobacteria bacterium]
MLYDVIVVGLGPGGATAAYELASRGFNVLAFDKENFPRYKPCGGCLSLKVEKILPVDFKHVVEDTAYGAVFTFKSKRPLPILSQRPVGYNVSRSRFDNLLKEKAKEAGVCIRTGERALGVEEEKDCVRVKTSAGTYGAKVLIGADGANSIIAREVLGLKPSRCAVALEAELPLNGERLAALKGRLLIDFGCIPHGYAWVFPKDKSISAGIAGVSQKVKGRIKECFRDFVSREEALAGLDIKNVHGWTIPYYYNAGQRIAKGRILAVGDAARLVDPFLGEGIYYAIRSGQIAAAIIAERIRRDDAPDMTSYHEVVAAELYPDLNAAAKLGRLVYNFPRLWYNMLESEPSLMESYYDVVRGDNRYEGFYSDLMARIKARPWRLLTRWLKKGVQRV